MTKTQYADDEGILLNKSGKSTIEKYIAINIFHRPNNFQSSPQSKNSQKLIINNWNHDKRLP